LSSSSSSSPLSLSSLSFSSAMSMSISVVLFCCDGGGSLLSPHCHGLLAIAPIVSGPGHPLHCSQSLQSTVGIPPAIHPTSSCSRGWVQVVYCPLSAAWGMFAVAWVIISSCQTFLVEEVMWLSMTWHWLGCRQVLTWWALLEYLVRKHVLI
jgi:hypothetical protein